MEEHAEAEFDFVICSDKIRPIVDALIQKYPELHQIDSDKILFVFNRKSTGRKKQMVLVKTCKVPSKWTELLGQRGLRLIFI